MKRAALLLFLSALALAGEVDFTRDVHPILAEHCFACHGGDKRSGGLSLRDYSEVLKGGRSGPVIVPDHSAASLLIQRVTATSSFMPLQGRRLTTDEIATLQSWIDAGARETPQGPVANTPWVPTLELSKPEAGRSVDYFVTEYLRKHGLTIPARVPDRVFARRAYLDIWGLLPMPQQLEAFLASRDPGKRPHLIDTLLANRRNYADHWISFWNDLLRNDEGVNYAGTRKSITPWLYTALQDNLPYNQFVEKLLNPVQRGDPDGFLLGVNWRGDVNASQLPVMQAAQNSAQIFLGVNLKCNSCHDSFISKWKLKDAYGLAAFFSDAERLELVRCDAQTGQFAAPKFLYSELDLPVPPKTPAERKAAVASMFSGAKNGRTPRTIVNRIWARLMGRGLVIDVDDMDGEPWSRELLDWLAADFVEHGYDLKHLLATIMTSQAYQLPSVVRPSKDIQDYVFHGPEVRRMTAEEFADALSAITGEWRVYMAQRKRGVYSREWSMPSSPLTRSLGRPIRDQVFTERNQDATALQALELVNGEALEHKLARGSKRMLGELPPAPENLFDSGRVTGTLDTSDLERRLTAKSASADIDISGVSELHLLTVDQGSYSPERVVPAWGDAVLVGPLGETRLSALKPKSGQATTANVKVDRRIYKDALVPGVGLELVYDIGEQGYTRLRATVGLDEECVKNDITPALRFFVFREKPDMERLVNVDLGTPVEPLHGPFVKARLITTLFEYMLNRQPSVQERKLATAMLSPNGTEIEAKGLADLLWAIAMQPEFQLIY